MSTRATITPTEAARLLGSIITPKKTASSSRTVRHAIAARRAQRKPLSQVHCGCGAAGALERSKHAGSCPMYHALYYRERKGLPLE
jgi:hypothetical protein